MVVPPQHHGAREGVLPALPPLQQRIHLCACLIRFHLVITTGAMFCIDHRVSSTGYGGKQLKETV